MTYFTIWAQVLNSGRLYHTARGSSTVWFFSPGQTIQLRLEFRAVRLIDVSGEPALANTASAVKRIRSNNRKRIRNKMTRSRTRTAVRQARDAEPQDARQAAVAAMSALDRAAQKGVIHPNNAARRKSRLMKRLAKVEAGETVE
jgi:small subunit ribosomal protein S20